MTANRYTSYEAYSPRDTFRQAETVHKLVDRNRHWLLKSQYAGVVERYHTKTSAAWNVLRLALNTVLTPVVLYDSQGSEGCNPERPLPIGLGTIINEQGVKHRDTNQVIKGADVDYWLTETHHGDPEAHRQAAKAMIIAGREAVPDSRLFATVVQGEPYQPVGFAGFMSPIGKPSALCIPDDMPARDPFGVTREGQIVQLYADSSIRLAS